MNNLLQKEFKFINIIYLVKELIKEWGEDGLIWLDGDNSHEGKLIKIGTNPIKQYCCRDTDINVNPFNLLENLGPGHWTGWLAYEAASWIEKSVDWKPSEMSTMWIASHDPIIKIDLRKKILRVEGLNQKSFSSMCQWISSLKEKKYEEDNRSISLPINSWEWDTSQDEFSENVIKIKRLITQGDIFQANLTTGCSTKINEYISPIDLYLQLKKRSPAPFSGVIIGNGEAKGESIISTSPERFLKVSTQGYVETRPIKGTRPRSNKINIDADMAIELLTSQKDRAENIMIVDLLRNDLGRVCIPGTVQTPLLLNLESYANVHHLTSVIRGKLKDRKTWVDLLYASWPGGSISGAPKIRACQRLQELEKKPRGPYCGSIINIDWDGSFDSNILIRSLFMKDKILRAHAGCGIVADSNPSNEAEEMKWKLLPILKALEN